MIYTKRHDCLSQSNTSGRERITYPRSLLEMLKTAAFHYWSACFSAKINILGWIQHPFRYQCRRAQHVPWPVATVQIWRYHQASCVTHHTDYLFQLFFKSQCFNVLEFIRWSVVFINLLENKSNCPQKKTLWICCCPWAKPLITIKQWLSYINCVCTCVCLCVLSFECEILLQWTTTGSETEGQTQCTLK